MKEHQKGAALLLVFILMVTLLGLVLSFLFMVMHQGRHAGGVLDDEKAFFVSQAALRKGAWRMIYPDSPEEWDYNDPPGSFPKEEEGAIDAGDGVTATYKVTVIQTGGGGQTWDFRIEGEGTVHGITRRVSRDYQAHLKKKTFKPVRNSWREI